MKALSPEYAAPLRLSVFFQVLAAVLASIIMDGGRCMWLVVFSMIAYWVGVLVMVLRRPRNPTKVDRVFAGFGFVGVLFVAILALIVCQPGLSRR